MNRTLALFWILNPAVWATNVGVRELPCPFGEGSVQVYSKLSSNRLGGWDSDLANYAVGGQWRTYAISTCASSLYSFPSEAGPGKNLQSESSRQKLEALLQQAKTEFGKEPPVWDRYTIAIRILSLDANPEPSRLAKLALNAAWTARDEAVDVYKGLKGPEMAWGLIQKGNTELEKTSLDASTRKILLHNLARIAHRGGFIQARDNYLKAFEATPPLSPAEKQVLTRFRNLAEKVEPALLAKAAVYLDAQIAASSDSQSKSWAQYIRGDIARRAGETDKAKTHFRAVLASEKTDPQIRQLANWFLEQGL
jgi:tetratricopeptide (TPR) repeat protein